MIPRRLSSRLTPVAFAVLGAAAAALCGLALWQMRSDDGGPLALASDFRAPPPRSAPEIAALRLNARKRLDLSPADVGAWVSLAYAARAEEGRCGKRCNAALAQAYRVGPFDAVAFPGRARFALENWPNLDDSNRALTIRHMRYAWSTPSGRAAIKEMGMVVTEPSGRLAARMVAGSLRAQPLEKPDS